MISEIILCTSPRVHASRLILFLFMYYNDNTDFRCTVYLYMCTLVGCWLSLRMYINIKYCNNSNNNMYITRCRNNNVCTQYTRTRYIRLLRFCFRKSSTLTACRFVDIGIYFFPRCTFFDSAHTFHNNIILLYIL